MRFVQLRPEEYDSFQKRSPLATFLNSSEALNMRAASGVKVEYVGVKDDQGQIIAATNLTSIPVMKIYRYYYAQRGYLLDYEDKELVAYFTKEIRQYLHERKALYLHINPHVLHIQRDTNGNPVLDGFDHSDVVEYLKSLGYIHEGYGHTFRNDEEVRWEYVVDLSGYDEASLLKHFDQQTRWSINKTIKEGVKVRPLGRDELDLFLQIYEETAKRQQFTSMVREKEHYYEMFDGYGDHIQFLLAYIDTDEYIERRNAEKDNLNAQLAVLREKLALKPNYKKLINQVSETEKAIGYADDRLKRIREYRNQYGNILNLSTAVFMVYPYEMTYLYAGSDERFKIFEGPYALQWASMKYALQHGITRYNLSGISGDFSEDAVDAGVLKYKQGFNGTVEETIGDLILPIRPALYKLYRTLKP